MGKRFTIYDLRFTVGRLKLLAVLLILNGMWFTASAQTYENSWIDYSQKYYKIKVWQTGLYRMTASQLTSYGVLTTLNFQDTRKIQLFFRGQEQYIYIYDGNGNNRWDAGDYLQFFGQRNDGAPDSAMYSDASKMPNPGYSLFTDTAAYYLTASSFSLNNKRVTVVADTLAYNTTPSLYFIKESLSELTGEYNYGKNPADGGNAGSRHEYVEGEGWVGGQFGGDSNNYTQVSNIQLSTQRVYTAGPPATFETTIVGIGGMLDHNVRVSIPAKSYVVTSQVFQQYSMIRPSATIPLTNLGSSTTSFQYGVTVPPATTDYNKIGFARLMYPHTYQMENASSMKMWIPDGPSVDGKAYLDMTEFNMAGGSKAVLWDTTDHKLIYVSVNGANLKANVPNNNQADPKFCFLAAEPAITSMPFGFTQVNHATSTSFNNYLNPSVAKDSAYIIITTKKLWSEAQQYELYRRNTLGDKTVLVDIEELYDQFAYGVNKHPLAIRNFARFIIDKWKANPSTPNPPQAMFLLGKTLTASAVRHSAVYFDSCYVPTYGSPCSDVLLTAGLNGTTLEPAIPTGRLAAKTGNAVSDYLEKVKQYEDTQALSPAPYWMKQVLHFGGGGNVGEQQTFRGYLNNYASIISGQSYGAHVDSFYSNSGQIITLSQSAQLHKLIDNGVSLMTFFGHGSTLTFDQDIGEPGIYNNYGKYPIIIANSCFAGDIFGTSTTKSEQFVLIPQKGSIAYLASTALGYANYLDIYTNNLYRNIAGKMYGKTMGAAIQQTIKDISVYSGIEQTCFEMTWHGDPAIRANGWAKPDYSVTAPDISFTPQNITSDLDTFSIHIDLKNVSRATADTFNVFIKRTFPDGTDSIYLVRLGSLYNRHMIDFSMSMYSFKAAGLNTFTVTVDIPDSVPEMQDLINNVATASIYISSSDILPIYPVKYAIHPYSTVTLKASTSDPFAPNQLYRFEIDTTGDFNGAPDIHKTYLASSAGGVLEWANSIQPLKDSTVYFWRVANDSIQYDTTRFKWHTSSFIYIPLKTGWSQDHIHQFDHDGYDGVYYNRAGRKFDFLNSVGELQCTTYGVVTSQDDINRTAFTINGAGSEGEFSACTLSPELMIAVMDSLTLKAWSNCNRDFGQLNVYQSPTCQPNSFTYRTCRNRPENHFQFLFNDSAQMDSAVNMLLNKVPDNNFILVYTYQHVDLSKYPKLVNALQTLGSNIITTLGDVPYIFFVKKGLPATMKEKQGNGAADIISLTAEMSSSWYFGNVTSELIGPATSWTSLHWKSYSIESGSSRDSISLSVIGIDNSGNQVILISDLDKGTPDYSLASIAATTYPYLKLVAYLRDDSLRTPPQLDRWQVYYKGVPEAALNPARSFTFHDYSMDEGDTVRMNVAIDNIADLPMDSLNVDFYLYDNNRVRHSVKTVKMDSLRVGQSLNASVKFSSRGFPGANSLWVEANPFGAQHQSEQYHFNNIGEIKFKASSDVINPVLDVTFDGVHILDGDIVSAKPHIAIQLHDENKYLALNDTAKFRVYLTTPTQGFRPLTFRDNGTANSRMSFTGASLPNNSARIDYTPDFTEDGKYTLEVEATDMSLNESGKYSYRITFEVINKSTITNVLNYPNPFSTSTRFVYTLTGSEIPSQMRIRIMTISGKVVREIMLSELGNVHIGRNITDYAWDGKDEFGDRLANGLYLYQVTTQINGQNIEHRETTADSYFKKGWGKMYLLR